MSSAEVIERDQDMRKLVSLKARKRHRAIADEPRALRLAALQRTADLFREAGRKVPSHVIDAIGRLQP